MPKLVPIQKTHLSSVQRIPSSLLTQLLVSTLVNSVLYTKIKINKIMNKDEKDLSEDEQINYWSHVVFYDFL